MPEQLAIVGGTPIAEIDRYSGTDEEYKEVVSWTVSAGRRGELKEVSMVTSDYAKTHFKLTIAGEVQFVDKLIQAPLSLPFPSNRGLASEQSVILYAKSSDGSAIVVDGSICGCEY